MAVHAGQKIDQDAATFSPQVRLTGQPGRSEGLWVAKSKSAITPERLRCIDEATRWAEHQSKIAPFPAKVARARERLSFEKARSVEAAKRIPAPIATTKPPLPCGHGSEKNRRARIVEILRSRELFR